MGYRENCRKKRMRFRGLRRPHLVAGRLVMWQAIVGCLTSVSFMGQVAHAPGGSHRSPLSYWQSQARCGACMACWHATKPRRGQSVITRWSSRGEGAFSGTRLPRR